MPLKSLAILTVLLTACAAPRANTNSLQLGMTPQEVQSLLGTPDSSQADKDQTCQVYSLWRDFWNRKPGDYSDRYYVCYEQGVVSSYGNYEDN